MSEWIENELKMDSKQNYIIIQGFIIALNHLSDESLEISETNQNEQSDELISANDIWSAIQKIYKTVSPIYQRLQNEEMAIFNDQNSLKASQLLNRFVICNMQYAICIVCIVCIV